MCSHDATCGTPTLALPWRAGVQCLQVPLKTASQGAAKLHGLERRPWLCHHKYPLVARFAATVVNAYLVVIFTSSPLCSDSKLPSLPATVRLSLHDASTARKLKSGYEEFRFPLPNVSEENTWHESNIIHRHL